ncbi:MAG: hypothetical protein COA71_13125 [SAR86 cluster bacterium]|uniref:SnoaL-like domain-containing protein n=1 Tax=SAR86 cluster bacterium TaxID=2030880 RepID=A0A2A5C8M0_9GAMM|nr:MAG: hypothetical protein COA71_13125 [SAR86 cluster bacterium]
MKLLTSIGIKMNARHFTIPLLAASLLSFLTACSPGNSDLTALIKAQAKRLQRVEDVQAIEKLERAYGYYVDKHLWDQVVDLFAEESSVELDQRGIFLNKEGVERLFLGRLGRGQIGIARGTLFNHIQVQGVVDIDPGGLTAKGRYRTIVQVAGFGANREFWSDGIYENEFIKENNVWKFSKMKFWPTYYTPFDEGWTGEQAACINGDGTGLSEGADLPSPDGAGVFPNVYFPPFHYKNPVTGEEVDVSALNERAIAETIWPEC